MYSVPQHWFYVSYSVVAISLTFSYSWHYEYNYKFFAFWIGFFMFFFVILSRRYPVLFTGGRFALDCFLFLVCVFVCAFFAIWWPHTLAILKVVVVFLLQICQEIFEV